MDHSEWCVQALLGLQHMHRQGILHRDIKSLNLLLDADKQLKIADLGIATVSAADCLLLDLKHVALPLLRKVSNKFQQFICIDMMQSSVAFSSLIHLQ